MEFRKIYNEEELYHYGVLGMKWGKRKAQYFQSSNAAKARYRQANKQYSKDFNKAANRNMGSFSPIKKHRQASDARWNKAYDSAKAANKAKDQYKAAKAKDKQAWKNSDDYKQRKETIKKAAKVGAAVAGTAIAAYGAYKLRDAIRNKDMQLATEKGKRMAAEYAKSQMSSGKSRTQINMESMSTLAGYQNAASNRSTYQAAKRVYKDYKYNRKR